MQFLPELDQELNYTLYLCLDSRKYYTHQVPSEEKNKYVSRLRLRKDQDEQFR